MTRALLLLLVLGAMTGPAQAGSRIRILGSVQDGGLPHVACRCDTCEHARDPNTPRRWVSSVAILAEDGERTHVSLLDATPDLAEQLELLRDVRDAPAGRVDRSPVDAVFLTHAHMGHYTGLADLGFEAVHARSIPLHASLSMTEYLRTNGPWSQLVAKSNVILQPFPSTPVRLPGRVTVEAFDVPHRDEYTDTVGFLIRGATRTVCFVPDTDSWRHWDPSLEAFLDRHGVDLALLDGTFYSADELPGRSVASIGHPLIQASMDRLQPWVDAGRAVWFIHLNHSNPGLDEGSEAAMEIAARGFRVAREGDEFDLD